MKQRTASFLLFVGGAAVVFLALLGMLTRGQWAGWWSGLRQPDLPTAVNLNEVITAGGIQVNENGNMNVPVNEQINVSEPEQIQIPAEFNLDIPFTSQAPFGNWDVAHEEYCEEASLLMANRFLLGRNIDGPTDADQAMNDMAAWEVERFGYFESTTAEETASVATEYLGLQAEVLPYSYTAAQEALVNGRVVIIPAAGRELGNPNFTAPGPIYHMLVMKGWTEDYIITNDPGTRKGENYVYDPDVLYTAVGDYNHNDPANGEKLMVVVWK